MRANDNIIMMFITLPTLAIAKHIRCYIYFICPTGKMLSKILIRRYCRKILIRIPKIPKIVLIQSWSHFESLMSVKKLIRRFHRLLGTLKKLTKQHGTSNSYFGITFIVSKMSVRHECNPNYENVLNLNNIRNHTSLLFSLLAAFFPDLLQLRFARLSITEWRIFCRFFRFPAFSIYLFFSTAKRIFRLFARFIGL